MTEEALTVNLDVLDEDQWKALAYVISDALYRKENNITLDDLGKDNPGHVVFCGSEENVQRLYALVGASGFVENGAPHNVSVFTQNNDDIL